MTGPGEDVDRRWRYNLMVAVETIADTKSLVDLRNSELFEGFFDCVTDEGRPFGARAMTDRECRAIHKLHGALAGICETARLKKRDRIGGKVVHGVEPEDLVELGWFEVVRPLALDALAEFDIRGRMLQ